MHDKCINFAIKIQSIAQAGLTYGKDQYDLERYQMLRDIAAEMLSIKTDLPVNKVYDLFCNEEGYQTPKIDTRGAVFKEDKILLVHENNGSWALPGGWCDVDQSISSNTEKEILEETGYQTQCTRLIAIEDWRQHNVTNYAYGVMKVFMLCHLKEGSFKENIETTEIGFFSLDHLPSPLANEKSTKAQIEMCFKAYLNPNWKAYFD